MRLGLDECFGKGLLRRIPASTQNAVANLKSARRFLDDAEFLLSDGRFESAFGSAYVAAFNAAKAILYRDGIDEKSHGCTILYLKSRYSNEFESLLDVFDDFRKKRHGVQYAGSEVSELELRDYISFSKDFIAKIEDLLSDSG